MILSGGELVLSESAPTFARSTFYPSTGIGLTNLFASYGAIYKAQLWVYTLVRKRALATRRLPFKVYRREGDGGRTEQRDSPFAKLLRFPNPRMSAALMWEWTSSTLDIYGEAIWLKVRDGRGKPGQLWPVHPSNISTEIAVGDRARQLGVTSGSLVYVYYAGVIANADPAFVIPETDVVHFKNYNPEATVRGLSPLEPLRQTLVNEDAARRASTAFWSNGARPSGYLSHPKTLSDGAMKRLSANWNDIHGGVDNFGKWAILEEGMEPKVLSLTAEESQYIESRKLNREEACAVYDTPPPVVHILDRATFSNITEQMRSMYRDTMAPHLGGFEATVEFQLRPEFAADGDLYGEFLMDEVLRGTFEERMTQMQAAVNSGLLTPNEGRAIDNRPAMPGGDRLYVNATLIPIDEVSSRTSSNQPATTPSPSTTEVADEHLASDTPDPAAKALTGEELRSLMGRLGRVSSLEDVEVKALVLGLNGSAQPVSTALRAATEAGETLEDFKARLRALASVEAQ
jgi:HK97 family phage portal protein